MTMDMQERIARLLEEAVEAGSARGLQVAAYHNGALVVDAWAGNADKATGKPVDGNTLFPVYSVSKGIAATIVHRLVERGTLRYDMRIAEVWPEFAAHGKDSITLRHALNHTAGIPYMPVVSGFDQLCDWDAICALIADLAPQWPPGTKAEYHAMTFGWIVGEVARRSDGRSFPQLVSEEICRPIGADQLYIGIPDQIEYTIAELDQTPHPSPQAGGNLPEAVPSWMGPLYAIMNREDLRRACIPATSGVMSARALARHYAALLPGGVDGVELLPQARVEEAIQRQENSWKLLGYSEIEEAGAPSGRPVSCFGHQGYGGSVGFADLERKLAVGAARNLFNDSNIMDRIVAELRALG